MKKKKINIVDIGVLLLLIIMVLAARMRFQKYHSTNTVDATTENIEYEVIISDIREFTANAFRVGDTLFDTLTDVEIGKIIDIQKIPYEEEVTLKDGKIVKSKNPQKFEVILKVQTEGIVNSSGYYANRTVELKVGSEKKIETLYAKSSGQIKSINKIP